MTTGLLDVKSVGFKDLTQLFDTAPAPYDPRLEPLYQQRANSKHGGDSRDSHFDENAVTKWMSDDEEEAVYKSKTISRPSSSNLDVENEPISDAENDDDFHKSRASTIKESSRLTKEASKTPQASTLHESDVVEFDDAFDLDDEKAWSSVPRHHAVGRFSQYRKLSETARNAAIEKLEAVKKITDRKVQTLKGQFQDHKTRWIKERDILLRAVHSSEDHREVAQGFAERAVDQMESMIATAEEQESMAPLTEPSERESVMRARVSFLEIANAELQEKLSRTEEIARNLEAQVYSNNEAAPQIASDDEEKPVVTEREKGPSRALSTRSKKVTITSAYEEAGSATPPAPSLEPSRSLLTRQSSSPLDSVSTVTLTKLDAGLADAPSFHTVDTVFEEELGRLEEDREPTAPGPGMTLQQEEEEARAVESSIPERLSPERSFLDSEQGQRNRSSHISTGRSKTGGTRQSSGLSSRLSEARQTVAETRQGLAQSEKSAQSRAAVLSATRRMSESLADAAELDENADMPFPPDPKGWPVEDRNTAVSTASSLLRKEIPLVDHPIVQEYVRTYEHLMEFKEKLGTLLQDKELMSHASTLSDLEPMTLKEDAQIAPQVEEMGRSIVLVLDQTLVLVRHMLTTTDRDYPVSSLRLSDFDSSTAAGESQRAGSRTTLQTLPAVNEAAAEADRLRGELADLHRKYNELKAQLEVSNKKYENHLQQNTSIMLEMQTTITNLKRELTGVNESNATGGRRTSSARERRSAPKAELAAASPGGPPPLMDGPEPSVIFTRLDYERNSKSLKRAVIEARLDADTYQDALQKMEEYTRIPAQRLGFIVRKYLHHRTMQRIQENAKRHKSLNAEVFQLWDNMELMEMKRHRRYAEIMDYLSQERLRLAQVLVSTFESIEERCSIFLIKPVLSLKSREQLQDYYAAMLRLKEAEQRQRRALEEQERKRRAMAGVHPTPEVSRVSVSREMPAQLRGSGLKEPAAPPPVNYWSPSTAQNGHNYLSDSLTTINTPRLLEMDVNRILLGQNNVSVPMGAMAANAPPQMSVRTYISVARPSSQPKVAYMYDVNHNDNPDSPRKSQSQKVPPSTPLDRRGGQSAGSVHGGRRSRSSKDLSGHVPLPPITPTPRMEDGLETEEEEEEEEEPPVAEAAAEEADEKSQEPAGPADEEGAAAEQPSADEEEEESAAASRPLSAVMSVSVSPRAQPLSSAVDDEREDSAQPSGRSASSQQ